MIKFQNAATFSIVLKKVSTANFRQRKLLIIVTIIRMHTDDCGIVGLTLS